MNFVLTLYVCSIVNDICIPPLQHETLFDDWYSCMTTGHADALDVYMNLDLERTNLEQLAIGFDCTEFEGDII